MFIKLTQEGLRYPNTTVRHTVYVNTDYIIWFQKDGERTRITTTEDDMFVTETPEEINRMMK